MHYRGDFEIAEGGVMGTPKRTLSQRIETLSSTWMRGGYRALYRGDRIEAARCFEKARYWASRQNIHLTAEEVAQRLPTLSK